MELPACPEVGACHSEGTSPGTVHLIRDYCREFFVSKGMIADFAIHDKGSGNLHTHILFTMRAMDETGKWLPKSRKIYGLDENGERIRFPSGRWKSHKEDTVDWNDQKYCEIWRYGWALSSHMKDSRTDAAYELRVAIRSRTKKDCRGKRIILSNWTAASSESRI